MGFPLISSSARLLGRTALYLFDIAINCKLAGSHPTHHDEQTLVRLYRIASQLGIRGSYAGIRDRLPLGLHFVDLT